MHFFFFFFANLTAEKKGESALVLYSKHVYVERERERERESNAFWCFNERKKRVMTMESCVDFVSPPLFKKETQQQQKKERKGRPKEKERERKKKQTDILKP